MHRFRIVIPAVALTAIIATGCGGQSLSHKVHTALAKQGCLVDAEHAAEASAIRQQVSAGTIGRERITRVFPKTMLKSAYLTADGNLRPYSQIHGSAMTYFDVLRVQLETTPRWHAVLHSASQQAFKNVKQQCEALK